MFLFKNKFLNFNKRLLTLLFSLLLFAANTNAAEFNSKNIEEIDSLRNELFCLGDKNSSYYKRTKQKLDKLIQKDNLDYTPQNRFDDCLRLINNQKFYSASYELNELILSGYEVSKCYELLGDISNKTKKSASKIAFYYKEALKADKSNISVEYKLSKLYLRENKNVLGIEHLRNVIKNTTDRDILCEIQEIILNHITPQNRFEANNLYEALGWIYLKLDCYNDAYRAFERALELNPDDIFLKYYLADLYYSKKQNNEAINIYTMIIDENPLDSQIRLSKAKISSNIGDINSAYKEYLEILSLNPDSSSAKYGIYKLFNNLSADEILKKIYKDNNYTPKKEDYLQFALLLKNKNDFEGEDKFLQRAKAFDKKEESIKEQPKKEQIEKGEIKKETKEIKKEEQKPQTPKKEVNQTQNKEQKPKPPQKKQEKAPQKKQINKQQNNKLTKKQEQKILKEIRKPLKIDKTSKKYLEFKKVVDKYKAIEPKDKLTYIAIANTYKLMGELYLAIDNYNNALKIEPTDSDIQYNLGLTYMELNEFKIAKVHLEKAINLNPQNQKAINLLSFVNQKLVTNIVNEAYSKFEKEQYIPAFQILENGIKEYPKNAQLYYYRALVFGKMNRNAAQIIDLQKSIELDPSYYMSYYQLGLAYEKIKDERSALVAYERFLSIEPDEKDLIKEVQQKVMNLSKKYY